MKKFDYGSLYIVPWTLRGYPEVDVEPWESVTIIDGSYVVILGIEESEKTVRSFYSDSVHFVTEYIMRLMTLDGMIVHVVSSKPALDYWKPVQS